MQKHTKIYLDGMGFDETSYISCEVCGAPGVDCHHISARGLGGSKLKDHIENLICVCRTCHVKYGDKKQHKEYLIKRHTLAMKRTGKY